MSMRLETRKHLFLLRNRGFRNSQLFADFRNNFVSGASRIFGHFVSPKPLVQFGLLRGGKRESPDRRQCCPTDLLRDESAHGPANSSNLNPCLQSTSNSAVCKKLGDYPNQLIRVPVNLSTAGFSFQLKLPGNVRRDNHNRK